MCGCTTSVDIDRSSQSGEPHLEFTECALDIAQSIAPSDQHSHTPTGSSSATSANPPEQVEAPSLQRSPSVPRMTFISSFGDSSCSSMSCLQTLVSTNGGNAVLRAAGWGNSGREQAATKPDTPLPVPLWHHSLRCQLTDSLRFRHPFRHGALWCGPPLSLPKKKFWVVQGEGWPKLLGFGG